MTPGLLLSLKAAVVVVTAYGFQHTQQPQTSRVLLLHALTERQMQFWEDVEDGLKDIEDYYGKQENGEQNINRVWKFCETAKSQKPPEGYAEGHEPSEEHIEGLTAKPFWDVADQPEMFPWAPALEEQSKIIQDEFQEKLASQVLFASDSVWQNQVMGGGWSAVRLQRLGIWNQENCAQFPETYKLLRSLEIPLAVRGVCFARQQPGSGVQPHSDGRNFILTSHLGLQVPEGCWIQVASERQGWQVGRLTTLDTSFTHSTNNPSTDTDRHVLILDHWHPELTSAERAALEFVYDLRNKFESGLIPVRTPRSLEKKSFDLGSLFGKLTGGDN